RRRRQPGEHGNRVEQLRNGDPPVIRKIEQVLLLLVLDRAIGDLVSPGALALPQLIDGETEEIGIYRVLDVDEAEGPKRIRKKGWGKTERLHGPLSSLLDSLATGAIRLPARRLRSSRNGVPCAGIRHCGGLNLQPTSDE